MELTDILNALSGDNDAQAEAAVVQIADLPEKAQSAAIEALRILHQSSDKDRRWWCTRASAELPIAQTLEILLQSLADNEPSVRQCAALGIRTQISRSFGWEPDQEILKKMLAKLSANLSDPDPLAASLAADALETIGNAAVPQLLSLMENGPQSARWLVIRTLARIGDPCAIPTLMGALNEDSLMMEYWANEGLEKMGVGMTYFFP